MVKEQVYNEIQACQPHSLRLNGFNEQAILPYGLHITHLQQAMQDFLDFLGFINTQLNTKGIERLEKMLMPANFSSVVGEFMTSALPKYCNAIVKNRYHNGHPDLIPAGYFVDDAVQHSEVALKSKHHGTCGVGRVITLRTYG